MEISKKQAAKYQRFICAIAAEIKKEWTNVHYTAKPYLSAMMMLTTINDYYGLDSAKSIIQKFLGNAVTWKGATARRIKLELNNLIK